MEMLEFKIKMNIKRDTERRYSSDQKIKYYLYHLNANIKLTQY